MELIYLKSLKLFVSARGTEARQRGTPGHCRVWATASTLCQVLDCGAAARLFVRAAALLGLALPVLDPAAAATLPAPLLVDQTVVTNEVIAGHGYGHAVAIDGDVAVVGVDGGDPLASAQVFERTGTFWQRLGRLTDSRASIADGFGYSVAVDGDTIAIGDPQQNNWRGAAYVFKRASGPGLNAWNITDRNLSAVGPSYIAAFSTNQYASLTTNAWRLSVRARLVHDFAGGVCQYFSYGTPTNRFIFFLDFTPGGDLLAQINGVSGTQFVLTTNGTGADDYHLHELEYNPATRRATYRFDGRSITNWPGEALAGAHGVRWGAGSTPGVGSINVNQVRFEATGSGAVLAGYEAGTPAGPTVNIDPLAQGWSPLVAPGAAFTSRGPVTPDATTLWTEEARVTAPDGSGGDQFGHRVALSGDTMVVGAHLHNSDLGAAYVFVRQGTNWILQAKLTAAPGEWAIRFGESVAIEGDTIVVGRPSNFSEVPPSGDAFVFVRTGTNWTQQAVLTAPDGQEGNGFGHAVAIQGNRIAVGAPYSSQGGASGAVYVFEHVSGDWSMPARLVPSPVTGGEEFGSYVDLFGDTVICGGTRAVSYLFGPQGSGWVQTLRRVYTGGGAIRVGAVSIDGETTLVGVPGGTSAGGLANGALYFQVPDYQNAATVATYANQLLYYTNAATSGALSRDLAAFRYKHLLYGQTNGQVRARFENMAALYGPAERRRADEAAEALRRGLSLNPDHPLLGHTWLDICYDRTVAETILAKDLLAEGELVRFGPQVPNGFLIDQEIELYRRIEATNRFAMQSYFDLLKQELLVQQIVPPTSRWAARVVGFSSQWTDDGPSNWYAVQALGQPDTYPNHGDLPTAWASATADDQREFLELGYDDPAPIDSVSIYETYFPGAVDKISVHNPNTGQWQEVWSGAAGFAGANARIFTVNFPLTAFPVDAVRLDLDSISVTNWNEIDAVNISRSGSTTTFTDASFGQRLFQTLVPQRGQAPATYTNGSGHQIVTTNFAALTNGMLYTGYKDLVLLFGLLRDYGRAADTLGRLLLGRTNPGDPAEAKALIGQAQQFLFLQGHLLKNMFPTLPPAGDPSGLAEAIAGWAQSLNALENLQQIVTGNGNVLGFADDFMMYVQKFAGQAEEFDSYDALKVRLNPEAGSTPLGYAIVALEQARTSYATYRGYEDDLAAEFDLTSVNFEDRLRDIVGVFPDSNRYSDNPTNNPGSELDQQLRSIQIATLRIEKNRTEISNLTQQVRIELNKAARISSVVIRFGEKQAQLTAEIGSIEALQAECNALAAAFSPDKIVTGLGFVDIANGAAQGGLGLWKAQLQADKERLAALQQATITGIEADAVVKTLLLQMATLAVDSREAALLHQQEVSRLTGLYREKADLERKLAEQKAGLAHRYFADPIHRLTAQADMTKANLAFQEAQKWLFFLVRALEHKWNTPFDGFEYPTGSGQLWSKAALFKLRNAEELEQMYLAMDTFESQIQLPKDDYFDWFSVREDFFGYKLTNSIGQAQVYADPITGEPVGAVTAFRSRLRQAQDAQGNIRLEFSTVRELPGGTFFRGPRFNTAGQILSRGLFLDKIRWIKINLPGAHTLGRTQVSGELTYGGTSFIRNFDVGTFDPLRPDRLREEMTAYATRFWFFHAPSASWRFNEALSSPVAMRLSADPRVPPTVQEIDVFKERSVATSGWALTIPTTDLGQPVLNLDQLDDVELYFYHYAVTRQQ